MFKTCLKLSKGGSIDPSRLKLKFCSVYMNVLMICSTDVAKIFSFVQFEYSNG